VFVFFDKRISPLNFQHTKITLLLVEFAKKCSISKNIFVV